MDLIEFMRGISYWKWFYIVLGAFIAIAFFVKTIQSLKKTTEHHILRSVILSNLKLPLLLLVLILSVYYSLEIALYNSEVGILRMIKQVFPVILDIKNISVIVIITWYLLRVVHCTHKYLQQNSSSVNTAILAKALQILIMLITGLLIIDKLGININGIITFGGIGGIAAGLAAKDLLANFFGSLVITLDKPFVVGDRVLSPDKQIAGFVVEIGWRLTKIMTYEKRPIYIPNSLFSTIIVQNDSRMSHRRINDILRVRFEDIDSISTITQEVESMLTQHLDIDSKQMILSSIDSIGGEIFTLHIYAFIRTNEWGKYKKVRQDVLIKISHIVNSVGAKLIFPESTVEVYEKQLYEALNRDNLKQLL